MTKPLTPAEKLAMDLFVNTPPESASNYVRFAKDIKKYPGVTFGCSLDDTLIPLRPGRALGLLARPGMNKTTFGGFLVLNEAKRIAEAVILLRRLYQA